MPTLLVIEDEAPLREEILDILNFEGYTTIGAENGRVGVQQAIEKTPDLIICDIMMPELNGYQVLIQLRRKRKTAGIPFIFLTARADRSFMRQGMELGADDYLTKPFAHSELLNAIQIQLKKLSIARKIQEIELQKAREKLINLVAHELRTPLTGMVMANGLLQQHMSFLEPDQLASVLESLDQGIRRMSHLVEQMVYITQLEAGTLDAATISNHGQAFPIWPLLMEAINHARSFAHQNQSGSIRSDELEHDIFVQCDVGALKQALAELISNALSYSPEYQEVIISHWEQDGFIWIKITDRGQGMSERDLTQALESFQQIGREVHEQQGIGLGLPLARQVISVHGGRFTINSVEEKGTEVIIGLPSIDHPPEV